MVQPRAPNGSGDNPFDALADEYDAWFDTTQGRPIFRAELECLRPLVTKAHRPWLEIGVGTGRFAQALGVEEGIDPSVPMLKRAAMRGIRVRKGIGENLPYADSSFSGVLMVVTLCFLAEPQKVFGEAARVLKPGGRLVVGLIPADSPWGEEYARRGKGGHPIYGAARFYEPGQVIAMAESAGLYVEGESSCLFTPAGVRPGEGGCRNGVVSGAGFVAIAFGLGDGVAEHKRTDKRSQRR